MSKQTKIPAFKELTFEWGEKYQRAKRSVRQLLRALEENKAGDDDDGSIQTTQGSEDQMSGCTERTRLHLAPRELGECERLQPWTLSPPPETVYRLEKSGKASHPLLYITFIWGRIMS